MFAEYLVSVLLFSISASLTPGPNTIMALASGINFGVRRSLPLLWGISVGFSLMLLLVGMGFGQVFVLFPQLSLYLKIVSIIYLFYLAYMIAHSGDVKKNANCMQPLSFFEGATFQWVNAKAWIVCISAVATFASPGNGYFVQIILITCAFLVVGPLSVGLWVLSGAVFKSYLSNKTRLKRFNLLMAFLLISSITPVIRDLWSNELAF